MHFLSSYLCRGNIASVSANNDVAVGKIMAKAFQRVGKDGQVVGGVVAVFHAALGVVGHRGQAALDVVVKVEPALPAGAGHAGQERVGVSEGRLVALGVDLGRQPTGVVKDKRFLVGGRDGVDVCASDPGPDHIGPHAGEGLIGVVAVVGEAHARAVGRFEDNGVRLAAGTVGKGEVEVIIVRPAVAQGPGVDDGAGGGCAVVGALEAQRLASGGDGEVGGFIVVIAGVGVDRATDIVLPFGIAAEGTLVGGATVVVFFAGAAPGGLGWLICMTCPT